MQSYVQHFVQGRCYFLTFKSDKKSSHQSIGFVQKLCKKAGSSTYIIVREANKAKEGYHFHALFKCASKPVRTWFIKGAHMHCQRVGLTVKKNWCFSGRDIYDAGQSIGFDTEPVLTMIDEKLNVGVDRIICQQAQHQLDVEKILHYMAKDFRSPQQYADYIISIRGSTRHFVDKPVETKTEHQLSAPLSLSRGRGRDVPTSERKHTS